MIITQLSVFLENKSGRLTEVTKLLAENNINISAFSIADSSDYGILRMIVSNPDLSTDILKKNGFSVSKTEVVCLIVPHLPGGLHKALDILSKHGISVDYMYAYAMDEEAIVVIRSESLQETIEVLQKNKMELVKTSKVYKL